MDTKINQLNIPYSKRWYALALLCVAQFMVIMDTSIIGVALPAIQSALNYSNANLQWIFNAYVIFFGGLLLLGGKMSDLYGPRKVFSWGFVILTIASLLAGLAWNENSMNIGRALQGLGSALIAPSALTLLMTMFNDPKEINKALGFWGASAAAGGSAGVFLGGVITQWISWRWVFFINIPIGIIVLLLISSLLLKGSSIKGKLDIIGTFLITIAMVLLVYSIVSYDSSVGFTLTIGITFVLSIIGFILFVILQKSSSDPLLPLHIFSRPNLSGANIVMALMAASWIPLWFFLNLYLQKILNLNAYYSGLALLPMTIAIMIIMVGFTGKLVAKFGIKSILLTGLLLLVIALIMFANMPIDGNYWTHVIWASLIAAAGMSLAYVPGTIASMSGVEPQESGLASGIVNTSYQIGSAVGLAIAVLLSNNKIFKGVQAGLTEMQAAYNGFQTAFYFAAGIALLSLIFAITKIKK